ncbi:single-stranded DNA-binding protein [Acidiferrobacter sp.]|uniref:single-stranded DNA-binding protein n=1 Tax=Acidiferrobacter sp. TaxID=1872107 RepID=UPI002607C4F7|nr:single-stranded DNA-binding protein [Acidiferrobacter sp.]
MTTKVTVKGHLARDPAKKTINGKEYIEAVVLSNEGYFNKEKEWVNTSRNDFSILFNAPYAEKNGIASMKKGDAVQAEGFLNVKTSEKDGVTYVNMSLRSPRMVLASKPEAAAEAVDTKKAPAAPAPSADFDDEIPF